MYYYLTVMNDKSVTVGEYGNWRDTGCQLHPSCLSCPLERCIEEVPRGKQRLRLDSRAGAMSELRRQGCTARQVAAAFGVSIRTVQRAMEKIKNKR